MAPPTIFNRPLMMDIYIHQLVLKGHVIARAFTRITIATPPPTRTDVAILTLSIIYVVIIFCMERITYETSFASRMSPKAYEILGAFEALYWLVVDVLAGISFSGSFGVASIIIGLALPTIFLLILLAVETIEVQRVGANQEAGAGEGDTAVGT